MQECSGVCPEVWWRRGERGVVWKRCSSLSTELLDENGSEKVVRKSIWSEEGTHEENKQYAKVIYNICIHESMNMVWLYAGSCKVPDDVIHVCEVKTELLLVCPDKRKRKGHKLISVNSTNQETCLSMWSESELFEFGSLLRCSRVDGPTPGINVYQ